MKVRIEEYGIAHELRGHADWRPDCLSGLTQVRQSLRRGNGVCSHAVAKTTKVLRTSRIPL